MPPAAGPRTGPAPPADVVPTAAAAGSPDVPFGPSATSGTPGTDPEPGQPEPGPPAPRLYARRFGLLAAIVALNFAAGFAWLTFQPVAPVAASFFGVSEPAVRWLVLAHMFAVAAASPVAAWALRRSGSPRPAFLVAAGLFVAGGWIRYAGTAARQRTPPPSFVSASGADYSSGGIFGLAVLGQVLVGTGHSLFLAAPASFADVWVGPRGKTRATALGTISVVVGATSSVVVSQTYYSSRSKIPRAALSSAILLTCASALAPLFSEHPPSPPPAAPPTPAPFGTRQKAYRAFRALIHHHPLIFVLLATSFYTGLFISLLVQMHDFLTPYGFVGRTSVGVVIITTLTAILGTAIMSSIADYAPGLALPAARLLAVFLGVMYVLFAFMPQTRSIAGPTAVAGFIGLGTGALVPIGVELGAEFAYPTLRAGPVAAAAAGAAYLIGAIMILAMSALRDSTGRWLHDVYAGSRPAGHMFLALVLQAILAAVVAPVLACVGVSNLGLGPETTRRRRADAAEAADTTVEKSAGLAGPPPGSAGDADSQTALGPTAV